MSLILDGTAGLFGNVTGGDISGNIIGLNGNSIPVTATGSTTARTLANRFADVVNVKDFGAVGDGIVDDTAAIQNAINTGKSVYFPNGIYKITSILSFNQQDVFYYGNGKNNSYLMLSGSGLKRLAQITSNRITFDNIGFYGDSGLNRPSIDIGAIKITNNAKDIRFNNCLFTEFNGKWGTNPNPLQESDSTYAVEVDANGIDGFRFESCRFTGITNQVDLAQSPGNGGGFCGGIYLYQSSASNVISPSKGEIINCQFIEIATLRPDGNPNSNINQTDADGIRTYVNGAADDDKTYNIKITGCRFINVQKSAIKSSGTAGLVIENNEIYSHRTDVDMQAAIRVQWTKSAVVRNTFCRGRFYSLIVVIGKDIVVDGVYFLGRESTDYFSATGSAIIVADTGFTEINLVFRNIYVNKCPVLFRQQDQPSSETYSNNNILLENIIVSNCATIPSLNVALIDVSKTKRLTIRNIQIDDRTIGNVRNAILLRDCVEVDMSNCQIDCTYQAISVDRILSSSPTPYDYKLSNINVWRGQHSIDPNIEVISFYTTTTPSTLNVDQIYIDGLYVSLLGTNIPNNSKALVVKNNRGIINNSICYVRYDVSKTDFNEGFRIQECTDIDINNINMQFEAGINPTPSNCSAIGIQNGLRVKLDGVTSSGDGAYVLNSNRIVINDVVCNTGQTPVIDLGGNTFLQTNNCIAF